MAALLVGAGAQDLRSMQIANGFSLAIAGLFVVWAAAGLAGGQMSFEDLALSLGCGVAVFGVGAAAFAFGALGGGDVKLLAAVSLFAGPQRLPDFLIITAVAGGLLGLAILAGAPIGRPAMAGAANASDAAARRPAVRPGDRRRRPVGRGIARTELRRGAS